MGLSHHERYEVLVQDGNIHASTQRRDVHSITKDLDFSAFTSATRILIRKGSSSLRTSATATADDTTGSGADERLSHVPIHPQSDMPFVG